MTYNTYDVEEIERLMNYLRVIKGAKNIEFYLCRNGVIKIYWNNGVMSDDESFDDGGTKSMDEFIKEMNNYYEKLEKEI